LDDGDPVERAALPQAHDRAFVELAVGGDGQVERMGPVAFHFSPEDLLTIVRKGVFPVEANSTNA